MSKRVLCVVLLLLCCFGGCVRETAVNTLTITMLDVGEADCFVLRQGHFAMLIDAGLPEHEDRIVSYLADNGIKRLDHVVLTHPHADHLGGMEAVFEAVPVEEFWYIAPPEELVERTLLHERMGEAIAAQQTVTHEVSLGGAFSLGTATVTVYPLGGEYDEANDYSVVCMVAYGGKRVLFTGDATTKRLEQLVRQGHDLTASILKLPHHGADSSLNERILEAVSPQYAMVSCGSDNNHRHPGEDVVTLLGAANVTLYRTDLHGTVTVTLTNEGIFWQVSH